MQTNFLTVFGLLTAGAIMGAIAYALGRSNHEDTQGYQHVGKWPRVLVKLRTIKSIITSDQMFIVTDKIVSVQAKSETFFDYIESKLEDVRPHGLADKWLLKDEIDKMKARKGGHDMKARKGGHDER